MASKAMAAYKQPRRPFDLRCEIRSLVLITLVSMCILPPTAILVPSEAMAAMVTSDLGIELSDLDYLCSHGFLLESNPESHICISRDRLGLPCKV